MRPSSCSSLLSGVGHLSSLSCDVVARILPWLLLLRSPMRRPFSIVCSQRTLLHHVRRVFWHDENGKERDWNKEYKTSVEQDTLFMTSRKKVSVFLARKQEHDALSASCLHQRSPYSSLSCRHSVLLTQCLELLDIYEFFRLDGAEIRWVCPSFFLFWGCFLPGFKHSHHT